MIRDTTTFGLYKNYVGTEKKTFGKCDCLYVRYEARCVKHLISKYFTFFTYFVLISTHMEIVLKHGQTTKLPLIYDGETLSYYYITLLVILQQLC